ncbi:MAG TPA: hypothetical protein VFZ10_04385 [Geminicoccaceae bacterium]
MKLARHGRLALAALALLAGATPAAAQSTDAPATDDRWQLRVAPYLWATSLDGNATVAGIKSDVDVSFSDILKDLSLAGMLLADFQRGRFGVAVNTVYARLTPENNVGPFEIKTTSDMLQLGVAPYYRLVDWAYRTSPSGKPMRLIVEPEAGFRFTYLRAELDVRNGGLTADESESWVEPLIGSRFGLDLSDRWNLTAEANVGGFGVGSDLAWNAQAFLGYRTSLFGVPTTLAAGYRALHQDYDHDDFKWDVTMHGPVLGAVLRF